MQPARTTKSDIRPSILDLLFITAAFVFFLLTIKHGHDWGDDFAQYINHAKNIAQGSPYKITGYIFNPFSYWIGPQTYPPVFPFLLCGVYALYGLDLNAMRSMILICYYLFLITFCIYCKTKLLSNTARISALLMVAFSPLYWEIKNSVISDIPFLMFLYIGLLLSERITNAHFEGQKAIIPAIAFGVICYLAYGTRSAGLFLILAFIISELYNRRAVSSAAFFSGLVFLLLFVWQSFELHTDKSYIIPVGDVLKKAASSDEPNFLDQLYRFCTFSLHNVTRKLVLYAKEIKWYWEGGSTGVVGGIATIATSLLCGLGLIKMAKGSISTGEVFFIIYSMFLLALPFFQGTRYLLPIFPMYAIYIFKAFDFAFRRDEISVKKSANFIIIAAVMFIYLVNYYRIDYLPYRYGIATKASQELFDYIKNATAGDSLVIFQKPRAMALFGERKSSSYHYKYGKEFDSAEFEKFLTNIGATHVVISNGVWGKEESVRYVEWAKSETSFLVEKYRNTDFSVYAIR